jgi:nucleoside-diphosphate-sugar epimerase
VKRIAIIGSNSFLAKNIYRQLSDKFTFTLFGRTGNYDKPFSLPEQKVPASDLVHFDSIIYCAAGGVQQALSDNKLINELNFSYPEYLLKELNLLNYKGIVITFGSYSEAGITTSLQNLTENDIILSDAASLNDYCKTKRKLTHLIATSHFTLQHYHFILPNFYGVGENANRLIPTIAAGYVNKEPINLTGGHQVRQFVAVDDLVRLIAKVMVSTGKPSGIYNVGSGEVMSVRELVGKIKKTVNGDIKVQYNNYIRVDTATKYLALNNTKTKNAFNWVSKSTVSDYFHLYCKHLQK